MPEGWIDTVLRVNSITRNGMQIRMRGKYRWNIGKKDQGNNKKNCLDAPVGSPREQPPKRKSRKGDNEVNERRMRVVREHLHTCGNANKLRNCDPCISNQECQHGEHRQAHTELLTNEIGEPFPCHRTHTGTHFL